MKITDKHLEEARKTFQEVLSRHLKGLDAPLTLASLTNDSHPMEDPSELVMASTAMLAGLTAALMQLEPDEDTP